MTLTFRPPKQSFSTSLFYKWEHPLNGNFALLLCKTYSQQYGLQKVKNCFDQVKHICNTLWCPIHGASTSQAVRFFSSGERKIVCTFQIFFCNIFSRLETFPSTVPNDSTRWQCPNTKQGSITQSVGGSENHLLICLPQLLVKTLETRMEAKSPVCKCQWSKKHILRPIDQRRPRWPIIT